MKTTTMAAVAITLLLAGPALAQVQTAIPDRVMPIGQWYKQTVNDAADKKIGQVEDALVDPEGRVLSLIINVGGYVGVKDHRVAVPFSAVQPVVNKGKRSLRMTATKEALKAAPRFKFDKASSTWR